MRREWHVGLIALIALAAAAPVAVAARLTDRIDDTRRVELPGHVPRAVTASVDLGAADSTVAAEHVFGVRMHQYEWRGQRHLANSANPTIPQALAAVVGGFASLHDFRLAPQFLRGAVNPAYTASNGAHALAPGDFATIYNLASTYSQGIKATRRTIAVIGRSDVQNVDINNFRSMFGLSAALPTVVLAGADPGLVANDQTESDLDLEWSGAIAPVAAGGCTGDQRVRVLRGCGSCRLRRAELTGRNPRRGSQSGLQLAVFHLCRGHPILGRRVRTWFVLECFQQFELRLGAQIHR